MGSWSLAYVARPHASYLYSTTTVLFASRRYGRENAPGGSRASVQKTGACHRHAPVGIRQRPTLPGRFQPSTIGAKRLNFCVRDGNRWIPLAITTGNSSGCSLAFPLALCSALPRLAYPDNCTAQVDLGTSPQYFSLLLRLSPRPISISNLHRLRGFQR